eukprot:scaffold222640_cov50-Prasinocladus_malaysianus.AAC.1
MDLGPSQSKARVQLEPLPAQLFSRPGVPEPQPHASGMQAEAVSMEIQEDRGSEHSVELQTLEDMPGPSDQPPQER